MAGPVSSHSPLTSHSEGRRLWTMAAAIAVFAVMAGVASMQIALGSGNAAIAPALVVVFAAAAVGIPLALRYPDVAVLSLVVVDLTRLSELTTDIVGVGVFQPLLLLAIASLGLAIAQGRLQLHWSPFYLLALALLAVMAGSAMMAGFSGDAMAALAEAAKDFVYFAVVLVWMGSSRSPRLAVSMFVFTLAALAALSVVQEFVFDNSIDFYGLSNIDATQTGAVTLRHSGPESDANFWARSLVVALPLACSSWATADRKAFRWAAGAATMVIVFGLYLTQSRGGLIAAVVGIAIWLVLAGRRYARWLLLGPLVLALLLVIPGVGSRLMTLSEVTVAGQGAGDPSLQGRVGAQRSGVAMFLEHPVIGIGFGEFRQAVPEYQRKLGIQAEVLDAHNLYLEIAAETGAVGLLVWGLFFGFGLFVALRVWLVSGQSGSAHDRWIRIMAAGVIAGLTAWLVASIFLHAANLRALFTVLAIAAGLDLSVRSRFDAASRGLSPGNPTASPSFFDTPGTSLVAPTSWRRAGIIALAITMSVILFGLFTWTALLMSPERWVATRHVALVASDEADIRYASYTYDLATRDLIGRTFAALLEEPEITLRAADELGWSGDELASMTLSSSYSPASLLITVRAGGTDPDKAVAFVAAVVEVGSAYTRELGQPFSVEAVEARSEDLRHGRSLSPPLIALLGILGSALMAAVWYALKRPSTPSDDPNRKLVGHRRVNSPRAGREPDPVMVGTDQGGSQLVDQRTMTGASVGDVGGSAAVVDDRTQGSPAHDTVGLADATVEDLASIPGVGRSLAIRIIGYRDRYGPLESLQDLLHVPGVGATRLEMIRRYLRLP